MHAITNPGRRTFLKGSAALGAGLILGFHLPTGRAAPSAAAGAAFAPNAFLRIAPDNTITVLVKHLEMGQGVYTGLPMLVAEELEAPWERIQVESAPADAKLYGNLAWGGTTQGTGGSTSLTNSWDQLRQAGAVAREMLIAAAAARWGVEPGALEAENGAIAHAPSGRQASYGELANQAAGLTPPREVKLKAPAEWKLIGKSLPRKDGLAKATGQAQFAGDLKLPWPADGAGGPPPRLRCQGQEFQGGPGPGRAGGENGGANSPGRGGGRPRFLVGQERAGCADRRMGRQQRGESVERRLARAISRTR